MKQTKIPLLIVMGIVLSLFTGGAAAADGSCEGCHRDVAEVFETSLHHQAYGMMSEYELGAAGHFGINMTEFYATGKCANCHVESCVQCHTGDHMEPVPMSSCDACHKKKQTSMFVGDMPNHGSEGPHADVHYEAGFTCTDCHTVEEMHGDGTIYETQLQAVKIDCEDCHATKLTMSHTIHQETLDCTACHTGWTVTCVNCHLETRKAEKIVTDEFYLLRGDDGKINSFLRQEACYQNESHVGYAEWHVHTVTAEGKDCEFCHEDPEVLGAGAEGQILGNGGSFLSPATIERVLGVDLTGYVAEPVAPEPEKVGLFSRLLALFGL